jgi:hypothetical protein
MHLQFNQGDRVVYTGKKFSHDLHGKVGEIATRIGKTDEYVVDFPQDSFVVQSSNLQRHLFSSKENYEPIRTKPISIDDAPAKKGRRTVVEK